ncbi:hypothetical protein RN001_004495 [Aquatica leii]|uniref:Uncharacterized protein n=1 Tax=Aquatica leii TaxID=1421715 RepID=A0AAN7SA50_9COLE|nr:hypothetical protein RN001_004495 [Aquatica leii]
MDNKVNTKGKKLVNMIEIHRFFVMNGCSVSNNPAQIACITPNGTSVIDLDNQNDDPSLSSSEPDPFAADHDSDDPDFVPSDTDHNSRGEQQQVDIERGNVKKKCRKKMRHTESWRRNVIRSSRNSGAEYVNWKGNVQSERKLKPPCQNCRNKCSEKFTEDERKSIFTNFWSLADINRHRDFLSKFVTAEEKQRCRKRPRIKDINKAGEGQVGNGEAAEKKQPKQCPTIENEGEVEEDKTGEGKPEQSEAVASRRKTTYKYSLSCEGKRMITVCKTFFLNTLSISGQMMQTVFAKIGSSSVVMEDRRGKACKNSKLDDSIKDIVRKHINSFETIETCQKSTLYTAVFDLQQVLPVPKSNVSLAYYKLKLSTYNFTIFNLATKDCQCYMWYECIAKRSSSEIGSCLLHFIDSHVNKGIKQFSFYSDNCAVKIRHTFLEPGHTQTEGDCVHSVIEKASRHIAVYTPEQWYSVVRTAKRKKLYYTVYDNDKFLISKLKMVEFNPDSPNFLFFKMIYGDDNFKKVNLIRRGKKQLNIHINDIQLTPLFKDKIPIQKKKYDHLQFLCKKGTIVSQYHDFFKNLPFTSEVVSEDDSE